MYFLIVSSLPMSDFESAKDYEDCCIKSFRYTSFKSVLDATFSDGAASAYAVIVYLILT